MAIINLPHQNILDRSTSPKSEGFAMQEVKYSGKIVQRSFEGATQEASREEVWDIVWKQLEYATPEQVALGSASTIQDIRDFYKSAHMNKVRWQPFEINTSRIWEVVPDSLKISNPAGCIFEAKLKLRLLYNE